ncbi:unnamed protein product [Candidula unifasciata]|uniref:THUMP domain-containing protein n=1 Tax=Candidula unifasciata TaxID=100452 RepID=A0A8S3Z8E3_9EUPU|nr:unnamed protein product [Candidula unifasciata]
MSSGGEKRGQKRSKAFYRKSAYGGGKRSRGGANVLEPGIRGFLVMCNSNESSAVKESYNILNEYADLLYGQEKAAESSGKNVTSGEEDSECEDVEKALKKEVDAIKNTASTQKRFQNVQTKAKNCVFIRTTIDDPVKMVVRLMEDIAEKGLKKARYAARMLPIIGTCKAHTSDIEKLAKDVLQPIFCKDNVDTPSSYTVLFKIRNNNANTCGKTSVIPAVTKAVSEINPAVKFSWTDFDVAVLVEVVCTVCCLGIAPAYTRLRKYNLQELQQGPKVRTSAEAAAELGSAEQGKPEKHEQCENIKQEKNDQCVMKPVENEQHETCVVNPLPSVVIGSAEKCDSADEVISDIKNFLPQEANSVMVCDDKTDGRQSEEVLEPGCLQSDSIPQSILSAAVDVSLNSQGVEEAS